MLGREGDFLMGMFMQYRKSMEKHHGHHNATELYELGSEALRLVQQGEL